MIHSIPENYDPVLLALMEKELEYFPRLRSQGVAPPPMAGGKCPADVVLSPRQFDYINVAAAHYFLTELCEPIEYFEDEPTTFHSPRLLASSWASTMAALFEGEHSLRQITLRNVTPGDITLAYLLTGLPLEFPDPSRQTMPSCVPLLMFSIKAPYRPLPAHYLPSALENSTRTNRWEHRKDGAVITTPHPYTRSEFERAALARGIEQPDKYKPIECDPVLYHFNLDVPRKLLEAAR